MKNNLGKAVKGSIGTLNGTLGISNIKETINFKAIAEILDLSRIYEIIVGCLNTVIIILIIVGSIYVPILVAIAVILFNIYWLYKLVRWNFFSVYIYKKIVNNIPINYLDQIQKENLNVENIYNLILITTYKEPEEVLNETLVHLTTQDFPLKRIIIVLATEDRDNEGIKIAEKLKTKYIEYFNDIWITKHVLKEGELVGKHSNERASSIECVERLENMNMDLKNILITSLDSDVIVPHNYLSNIAYLYIKDPERLYRFYHGANLYYSNFTKLPFIERIFATQLSLWYLASLDNQYLNPVSTYTLSLYTLKDIGYWDIDVITEDTFIFFKAVFKYKSRVKSVPIYVPLYMTMPQTDKYLTTLKSFYITLTRYTYWNISLNAEIIKSMIIDKNINIIQKFLFLWDKIETDILWPVYWFLLTFGANIFIILNPSFTENIIGTLFAIFLRYLIVVYGVLFITILLVDYKLRSRSKFGKFSIVREIANIPLWAFMPLVGFYTAFLPFIDSQIKFIINKRHEYVVSAKGHSNLTK